MKAKIALVPLVKAKINAQRAFYRLSLVQLIDVFRLTSYTSKGEMLPPSVTSGYFGPH